MNADARSPLKLGPLAAVPPPSAVPPIFASVACSMRSRCSGELSAGADGCFGECAWALSDKTIDESLAALRCSDSEKEDAKKALKEAEDKYGSNAAAKGGLSMIAAAATAAVAVAMAR